MKYLILLLIPIQIFLRHDLFWDKNDEHKPAFELNGVTDEHWYWTHNLLNNNDTLSLNLIDKNKMLGKELKFIFAGRKFIILLRSQCAFAYYVGIRQVCVMSEGLTDKYIAKLPIKERGRIGHERIAPLEYIYKRKINFIFNRRFLDYYYHQKVPTDRFRMLCSAGGIGFYVSFEVITMTNQVKNLIDVKKREP